MKTRFLFPAFALFALSVRGEIVHVVQQTVSGGRTNVLSDTMLPTGGEYRTQEAPAIEGFAFTHWSISSAQSYNPRDARGRAWDAAPFALYENITLTANYLLLSLDSDADGVPDGHELYWYGNLGQGPDSDTDGDGATFAEELAAGSNPLFPESRREGPIVWGEDALWFYNPFGYVPYTLRSEPEGALFETVVEYARSGATVATPACSPRASAFAYWTYLGVPQRDAWGRALDSISFSMPSNAVELVAVAVTNEAERVQLYWYGTTDFAPDSDTDGDGATFAKELEEGTNPLFPERRRGPMSWTDVPPWIYNPHGIPPYTLRSEPEGTLFATTSIYVRAGTVVRTDSFSPSDSAFAYWTLEGAPQRDAWGRALDSISFSMPSNAVELVAVAVTNEAERVQLYWYGTTDFAPDSDTDGDGATFAKELEEGTNPLFPERHREGPVSCGDSIGEMNLQPFEQMRKTLIDGEAQEVFTSPTTGNAAEAWAFGADLSPAVADLDGDGRFHFVFADASGVRILRNAGAPASPDFTEVADPFAGLAAAFAAADPENRVIAGGEGGVCLAGDPIRFFPAAGSAAVATALSGVPASFGGELFALDPATGSVSTTNGALALDTPIVRGISIAVADADGDGLADLLASDDEGRVWFYRASVAGTGTVPPQYTLQHKVWGGTHAGFAEGLKIAAVDWDDDGDLDCLCGTADGKLMLLRDPKVGRPTNLKAEAGIDTVVLTWDPNRQSRVRGYRVYRAEADAEATEARIAEPQLPAYRDAPPEIAGYDYKVSAVSRFYTAGNSTPTETESPKTEAVRATLGAVRFFWNDANAKLGDRVEVVVSIENALRYDVAGRTESVTYDPAFLRPVEVRTSGLTDGIVFQESAANGAWTVAMTRGVLPAGSGRFLTFVFDTLQAGTTRVGGESGAAVTIAPAGTARYFLGDVDGDGSLTVLDIRLLAKLKNGELGRRASAEQIQAGDFNGNGRLDNADYQALRALLKEKGVL